MILNTRCLSADGGLDSGFWMLDTGGWRSEVGGQRTEERCRVSGFRGQGLELKAEG
ncbi:hypothetical protein D3OALGB2SA_936 [Olavius algarvensis associated proteobacterium Delta 3]|nr:hypothetical protein D3OALGB2SA_936 [Olavius algarvensis associated proteobacterium Delta 3]